MVRPRDVDRFNIGLEARTRVLGEEYVTRALAGADSFNREFQELVTEYCWGAVWSRPGLDRRTRSLINLARLTALGRMHEFRVHVRGAITNGCTTVEISTLSVSFQAMEPPMPAERNPPPGTETPRQEETD